MDERHGIALMLTVFAITLMLFASCFTIAFTLSSESQSETERTTDVLINDEAILLARIVDLEAGDCSYHCKLAVTSVIVNRVNSGHWGGTISEVVSYPNAFTSYQYLDTCEQPSDESLSAVRQVLSTRSILPDKVMYFRDDYDFDWDGYCNYAVYDNMYFGYFENGDW